MLVSHNSGPFASGKIFYFFEDHLMACFGRNRGIYADFCLVTCRTAVHRDARRALAPGCRQGDGYGGGGTSRRARSAQARQGGT